MTWDTKAKPFVWNEEDRRHLRARLDALYLPPVRVVARGCGLRDGHVPMYAKVKRRRFATR